MADNEHQRLLWQQENTQQGAVPATVQEYQTPAWQQPSQEVSLELPELSAESIAFIERLQRLNDTLIYRPSGSRASIEPISWSVGLLSLFFGNWPLSLACMMLAVLANRHKATEARLIEAQAALDLAHYQPEWLGPLALALESPRPAVRPIAAQTLLRVLPRVDAQHVEVLDSHQRGCLYRRLIPTEQMDIVLALAILEMLESYGERECLPYVERLAHSPFPSGERRRLCAVAQTVLPRIRTRLERQEEMARKAADLSPSEQQEQASEVTPQEQTRGVAPQTRWAVTQVEAQLKLLEQEKRTHQQPGMRLAFLIASWCVIVPFTVVQTLHSITADNWPMAGLWGVLAVLATQLHRFCLSPKQTEAARKLATHDDVRGVGPLAEALEWPDSDIQMVASRALTRLLPRLQATDAGLLNAAQRANLYRKLNPYQSGHHVELQLAILKAMEQVGDEAAVPYVQRLAGSITLTWHQKRVRQAAQDCLPYLKDRAAQLRVSQTLLRASSATTVTPDMLLRPAENTSNAPEQLLRADERGSGE
jgi:hypothetical protein